MKLISAPFGKRDRAPECTEGRPTKKRYCCRPRSLFIAYLFAVMFALLGREAGAQESGITWTASVSGSTVYATQEAAEAAVRAYYGSDMRMKSQFTEDGGTTVTYWRGRRSPDVGDWGNYTVIAPAYGRSFDTEQEVVDDALEKYSHASCTGSVSALDDWTADRFGIGGISDAERKNYKIVAYYDADCSPVQTTKYSYRYRTLSCPDPFHWSDVQGACVSNVETYIYSSRPLACALCSYVGDPIDVSTGDLYETEDDFSLGWIAFSRYYHSATLTGQGIFGNGSWAHSHSARLSLSPSPRGIVLENGAQIAIQLVGGAYELADGSGDRVSSDGAGQWILQRSHGALVFDNVGRLVEWRKDDGSILTYSYVNDRLSRIQSDTGRSIDFNYADPFGDAAVSSISANGVTLVSYTYAAGRLVGATYPGSGSRVYQYTDVRFPNHLTMVKSEDGSTFATFAYDANGRAICSQQGGGSTCNASSPGANKTLLTYTPAGGAVVTDPLGHESTYGLTADTGGEPRQVSGVADATANVSRTYYDESVDFRRRLDTVTDRNGVQTKHTYGELTDAVTGQPASVHTTVEAFGTPEARTLVERRDLASNRLIASRQGDRSVRILRNARLQPTTVTWQDAVTVSNVRTSTYVYCEAADVAATGSTCPILGLPKSVNGPRIDVVDRTTYTYYPDTIVSGCNSPPAGICRRKGDLWKITDALGHVTEIVRYDSTGRVTRTIDPNGVVADYEYTPRGWLAVRKVRGPTAGIETDDRITRLEYFPTGLVKKITQPDGPFVSFTYDAAQRLTDVTDNAGNTIHYTLDNAGNRLQEDTKDSAAAVKRTLSRIYNQLGQLATQADASSNPTDFTYDANGNLETATDALTRVSDRDVDPLNRLTRTLQDAGAGQINADTKFEYDALDHLTKVTDPKGLDTTHTYNGLGDLTQLSSPDTGTTTYTFDSAGNRKTQLDARGVTTTYGYDALNRLTTVAYSDGTAGITYTYDTGSTIACQRVGATVGFTQGRLTRITDVTGYTEYCYNRFGDMVGKSQANPQIFNVRYGIAASGRLQNTTYPDGTVVDYVYNTLSQVAAIGVTPVSGIREVLLKTARYAPFGPITQWTWNNGRILQRPVDLDYRTLKVYDSASGGISTGYHYDLVGNVDQLWDGMQTTQQAGYDHDSLDRLKITRGPTNLPVESYDYDATGNRTGFTNNSGAQAYLYPADSHKLGSVAGSPRSYDLAGNTTANAASGYQYIYDGAGRLKQSKLNSVVQMNYRYNGKGERTRQFSGDAVTTSTYTVYDEQGHWMGDYDANGAAKQQAIWLGDLPVGLLVGAGSAQQLDYIEADHLGTPRVVIDPDRDVAVWRWDAKSEAFGNSSPTQDPDLDGTAFVFDMRFPGQRYDQASGLNQNGFRDYEAAAGRYSTSDPIGLNGGINTYSYVSGNPISRVDPLGLQEFSAVNSLAPAPGAIPASFFDPSICYRPRPTGGSTSGSNVPGSTAIGGLSGFVIGTWVVATFFAPDTMGGSYVLAAEITEATAAGDMVALAAAAADAGGATVMGSGGLTGASYGASGGMLMGAAMDSAQQGGAEGTCGCPQ